MNGTFNDDFLAQVELHQDSLLRSLLFIIVLEVRSKETGSECPEKLLYADELTLVSGTIEGLKWRLKAWRGALEVKGLRIKVK